jgi:hypothetical protein
LKKRENIPILDFLQQNNLELLQNGENSNE